MKIILLPIFEFLATLFFYLIVIPIAIIIFFIIGLWDFEFDELKDFLKVFFNYKK